MVSELFDAYSTPDFAVWRTGKARAYRDGLLLSPFRQWN